MIDVLAEAHGISKRIVENEYTRYDYYFHVVRKNLESAKFNKDKDKDK